MRANARFPDKDPDTCLLQTMAFALECCGMLPERGSMVSEGNRAAATRTRASCYRKAFATLVQ